MCERLIVKVKKRAVGEQHPEYVQSLVALAEVKLVQGFTPDALLLFKQAAHVLQHQDPTFSAGMAPRGSLPIINAIHMFGLMLCTTNIQPGKC